MGCCCSSKTKQVADPGPIDYPDGIFLPTRPEISPSNSGQIQIHSGDSQPRLSLDDKSERAAETNRTEKSYSVLKYPIAGSGGGSVGSSDQFGGRHLMWASSGVGDEPVELKMKQVGTSTTGRPGIHGQKKEKSGKATKRWY